ncbi:MAG: hypothetical protein AAF922_13285 [Pseudomonadota bacterium]
MIAIAAFVLFGGMLLTGALMTALTMRPSVAAMGVLVALPGGSGICVLLGAPWLALGFFVVSGAAIMVLHRFLAKGIGRPAALPLWNRKAGRGLLGYVVLAALFQIALALLGVEILPAELSLSEVEDQAAGASSSSGEARFDLALRDVIAVLLALPLVFVGFLASRALAEPVETLVRDPRQGHPYRSAGTGFAPRHRER